MYQSYGIMVVGMAVLGGGIAYFATGKSGRAAIAGAVVVPVVGVSALSYRAKVKGRRSTACFQAWCEQNQASCTRGTVDNHWYPAAGPGEAAFKNCFA